MLIRGIIIQQRQVENEKIRRLNQTDAETLAQKKQEKLNLIRDARIIEQNQERVLTKNFRYILCKN